MNEQKIIKFNYHMSCVLLAVLVLFFIGTTIAYFSDTKQVNNTFTAGNVAIALYESAVKPDNAGNLVQDLDKPPFYGQADAVVNDYGRVYPGQSIFKNPTAKNTGDSAEWIAVKVILTDGAGDLSRILGYEGFAEIDIERLLSGGLLDEKVHVGTWNGFDNVCHNDNYAMIQVADESEFYFLMLQPVQPGAEVTIFDHISFPREWSSTEMRELGDLQIQIQAFGVQTFQLESCLKAMTEAFPAQFPFLNSII